METNTIRVMTWNLWARYGPWEERQPAIVETLRRADPDVVLLQEVWGVPGQDQPARLAAALGFDVATAWSADPAERDGDGDGHGGGDGHGDAAREGCAILSRWPLRRTARLPLSDQRPRASRRALLAEVDVPDGPLTVVTAHLAWQPDGSATRQREVAELARFVAAERRTVLPPLLCGDLNAEPDADELRQLTGRKAVPVPGVVFYDAWEQAGEGAGWTCGRANPYSPNKPRRRVDYLLVGVPDLAGGTAPAGRGFTVDACRLEGTEPAGGLLPSDHFAVVADLRW